MMYSFSILFITPCLSQPCLFTDPEKDGLQTREIISMLDLAVRQTFTLTINDPNNLFYRKLYCFASYYYFLQFNEMTFEN